MLLATLLAIVGIKPSVPLIIFTGESNSGGYASNALADSGELAVRPEVRILNTTTLLFEDLDIGTNNNMAHANLNSTMHGIELELANAVAAGRFRENVIHIVQTGQGSSNIAEWDVGSASGFWAEWLVRVNAAKAEFASNGWRPAPVIFYSHGLNDYLGNATFGGGAATTDPAAWKTKAQAHIAKMRAQLGATTPVVMTKFKSTYASFNTVIQEIADADPYTSVIQTTDTGVEWQGDTYHWTYVGYKQLCQLFIDEITAHWAD